MGNCPNRELQEDWKACGEAAFEFETLELLEPLEDPEYDPTDDLAYLEATWLEQLQPYGERGYNPRPKPQP